MVDFTDNLVPSPDSDGAQILKRERAQSSLPVQELSKHLFSHDGFLERQQRVLSVIETEPLCSKTNQMNLSRPDRFHLGLARAKLVKRLSNKHGWDLEDNKIAEYLIDEMLPYHLHPNLFLTTVSQQGSEEQNAYWMPKIEKYEIIGAYAQTELGHGSNVKGLELEARWDSKTHEFVLHSPTLTSSKWWNGTLGRTANHAIVVAQLLLPQEGSKTKYKSFGPHPFVVQVRDMKTHLPLPGIVVGDIGAKFGYACMDNAYMLFNQFRIPHSAFLSRYSQVDPNTGTYSKPENPAVVYGTMTFVRSNIAMHARLILARAVTVAVRYTSIRRQFRDRDGDQDSGQEIAVLDYPTVQIRVLPLLATIFALHYGARAMGELYLRTREQVNGGDFATLADLHSTSSGLKSLCTGLAADGIETCRRAMGGHGYGGGSGLIQLSHDYLAKPTVEGDNWMITQQVASYLIKKMTAAIKSPNSAASDDTDANLKAFLKAQEHSGKENDYLDILNDDHAIVLAFRTRAAHLTYEAYEARIIQKRSWNSMLIKLHHLSEAQSQGILVNHFYSALSASQDLSSVTKAVLRDLYRLFALFTMENKGREFLNAGVVSNKQLNALPDKIQDLMARIRPHAVTLVDAWKIPDYLLNSALGQYDGKVYESLYNQAHRLNPLNKITFNPNYWEEEIVMGSGDGGAILAKL